MKRFLASMFLLLVAFPALAQTSAQYSNTNGSSSNGTVIMTSTDGRASQAVNATTPLPVAVISGGGSTPTGTAGTPSSSVVSVQGVSGGTTVPVSDGAGSLTVDTGTPGTFSIANTAFGATQSGTWNVTNVSGTVSLPTGAATAANQTSLAAQIPATLGAKTGAASLSVVPASDATFSTVPAGYSFAHIATATTTTVKSGAGVLHTLTVNNLGTVASTTTVYDNTAGSGTVIAVINTLAGQESYLYDVAFATGLTVVTTGTVAPDITISYR